MRSAALAAFALAGALGLLLTPLARLVALRHALVDTPSTRKLHHTPISYLGGAAIAVAAIVAIAATSRPFRPTSSFGIFLMASTAMGVIGLRDDAQPMSPRFRLALQLGASAAVALSGTRLDLTGVVPLDAAATVLFITFVANAFNLLDNIDGLSASVAAVAAGGIAMIGVLVGQPMLAVTGAATMGSTVGYLAYNVRPAMIFMGDAGSMFLGFLVAAMAVDAGRAGSELATGTTTGLVITGLLVLLPLADTLTVCAARTRRGISVTQGGKDHLSHRLVQRGRSHGRAVGVLVFASSSTVAIAVAVADGRIPPPLGAAAGSLCLLGVLVPAWRADVYPPDDPRLTQQTSARAVPDGEGAATSVNGPPTPTVPRPGQRRVIHFRGGVTAALTGLAALTVVGPAVSSGDAVDAVSDMTEARPRPGQTVVVTASGFAPGADVEVFVDGYPVAPGTADASGVARAAAPTDAEHEADNTVVLAGPDPGGVRLASSVANRTAWDDAWAGASDGDGWADLMISAAFVGEVLGCALILAWHRRRPTAVRAMG